MSLAAFFRDPTALVLLDAEFEESAAHQMPTLAVNNYGIRNERIDKRLWVKRWSNKDFFLCVRLATALGLFREGLSDAELLAADPSRRAMDVLELAWCMYVQLYRRGSREEYQWTVQQNDIEFRHNFHSLAAYLEAFAFPVPGFDRNQAADYLLRLAVAQLPGLVKHVGRARGFLGEVALVSAVQTADREVMYLRYSDEVALARAVHFLFGALWSFNDDRLAELLTGRILAEAAALGLGDAAMEYSLWDLSTCMCYTTFAKLDRSRGGKKYGIRCISPEDNGQLVNARTEARWISLWLDVLGRVAAAADFQLVCGFHLGKYETHPRFRQFEQAVESGRKRVLAVETSRRNKLRVRTLQPAFHRAQEDLCDLVLAFLG